MPSFDIVSEVDSQELDNAINQTNQEINRRFDLKDSGAKVSLEKSTLSIEAESEFLVDQVKKILDARLIARKLDMKILGNETMSANVSVTTKTYDIKEGISSEEGKKINRLIKDSKLKVQSSIQQDKVRVVGKKLDDLQSAIALIKENKFDVPLQFNNFRD